MTERKRGMLKEGRPIGMGAGRMLKDGTKVKSVRGGSPKGMGNERNKRNIAARKKVEKEK